MKWFILLMIPTFVWATEGSSQLKMGEMHAKIAWDFNETGGDALTALLSFTPNESTSSCQRLSFIQIAKVTDGQGKNYVWQEFEGQAPRNQMITDNGYFIDHDASHCTAGKTCSPFYRDSWPNPVESHDGALTAQSKQTASMFDAPYGWELFETIQLEACAICKNNDKLSPLACVSWGGTWPAIGDRKILPITFSNSASSTFYEALKAFNAYYSKPRSSVR